MGFFKDLLGIYLPSGYRVDNQTNYQGIKGILFKQYFTWLEDANKEFEAWIALGNYDTDFYVRKGGDWVLVKSYRDETKQITRYWRE